MRVALLLAFTLAGGALAAAQTSPSPGPVNPAPNPQAQPGATIVINPTVEQCRRGWNDTMRWTRQQFAEFCTKLGASK
ncbi:MAG: hypothetical protein NW223_03675 [Hyphomicrobiaceae bacterium]|nr:hypothetical protein [Hyphomicrobiaceae bacterium]